VTDASGGSIVQVYYNSGTNRRGPFTLWANAGGANTSISYGNILQTIDTLDSGVFTYLGTNGALELITQDEDHKIQAAVRTFNGGFSRTFPALADNEATTAASGRSLMIPNISNNASYRPSVVLFNPATESVNVEVKVIGADGVQIGSTATRAMSAYEMTVVTSELRASTYSNATVRVTVTTAWGRVMASGQTAHKTSSDPAAHIAVQAQ